MLSNVTSASTGVYSVVVSGPCQSVTNSTTLTMSTTVSATPLTNLFRFDGGIAIFNGVGLTAGPFTYQWSRDGNSLPNQTNSSLVLSNLLIEESGIYSVIVSSGCGSLTNSAMLTVAPCFPSLDVMLVIDRSGGMSGQPYVNAKTACTNFIRGLHLEANGDAIGLISYNPTPTLNQTLTNSRLALEQSVSTLGPATNGTCIGCAIEMAQDELVSSRRRPEALSVLILLSDGLPYDFDTQSNALYYATEAKNAGTRVFTVGFGEVDPALMASMASAPADSANDAGVYTVVVMGDCQRATNSATLSVNQPPVVAPLASLTRCPGDSVSFGTLPGGTGPLTFVWRKDGAVLGGQTNAALTIPGVTQADAGVYSVEVIGVCGSVTNAATLTVNELTTATPLANDTVCAGGSAVFVTSV